MDARDVMTHAAMRDDMVEDTADPTGAKQGKDYIVGALNPPVTPIELTTPTLRIIPNRDVPPVCPRSRGPQLGLVI